MHKAISGLAKDKSEESAVAKWLAHQTPELEVGVRNYVRRLMPLSKTYLLSETSGNTQEAPSRHY